MAPEDIPLDPETPPESGGPAPETLPDHPDLVVPPDAGT